ncbi:hypothetical protein [Bacillus sp. KH172YL63]|uniref:hypothetical protein n=1 Tax=Bacillus sp. KH172YL63 TaxID=2709784 RepID=UPI0013E45173|nr:hypothetical protein [Bacillus sp. KH172YL63]BCB02670.1 hypothetical protein KH172YL63_08030 [Bacillus sp. KH172YL63]
MAKKKYTSPHIQAPLIVTYAAFQSQLETVKAEISKIKQEHVRAYYEALLLIKENHMTEAEQIANSLSKKWMKEDILSTAAEAKGRHDQARLHRQNAISASRGVQRYLLIHK